MIPVLFKEDEQVFTHNGIGALYESLSCDVIEEENGAFTMELEYPVDGEWFSEIKDFRIIQAKPNDIDDPHNFRIYEIEKSIDELTVFVRANTRTNDLGNNLITNYVGRDVTPQQAMNGIKNNLIEGTNFDLISDIQTRSNVEWTRINPLNAIVGTRGSLVDIWGGQIKRTNTAIHLYSRRGRDNVVTIRPGKNIEGLNMTVSTAGLVTKILPTFSYRPVDVPKYQMVTLSDGTKEKRRVQASGSTTLRDDITVLGNVVSSQYVDNYPTNYWASVDYGDDDELKNKVDNYIDTQLTHAEESSWIVDMSGFDQELENFVKTELDKRAKQYFTHRNPGVDKPTVRITVNMLQLSDSPDWEEFKDLERIGLTDTLDVWVEEYDIDVEVRVTSLTYESIAEEVTNFNAGSDRAPRQSVIEKKYDDLTKATNDYVTSFKNGVQNILRNTADGLNRKFEGYTEPPAELSSEGDIWFKEIGEGKVEIWIHDGVYWQPLMTEDFANQIQAEVDEATEAANKAVDEINNAVEAAGFTSLEETVLDIQRISDTAKDNAASAISQAVDALNQASTAIANSGASLDIANSALGTANDAIDSANSALGTANDAKDSANSAQTQASNLSKQVSDFDITVDGFNQTINNYEGQVASLINDISGFESTVASYEVELDEYGNEVGRYATEVSTFRNTVDGFESTVATYGQEVNSLTGEVATYATQVSNFSNTVDGLNSTVASYEVELDEYGNIVDTYATQVSEFENTVDGLNSTVADYKIEVQGYSDDVVLYTNQVSSMQNTVDGFNSTVAQYTTEVDEMGNEVASYATEVSTMRNTVDGFNSTVTQVQYDLDNLEVGGRNLVSLQSMEYGYVSGLTGEWIPSEEGSHNRTSGFIDVSEFNKLTISTYDHMDSHPGTGRIVGYDAEKNYVAELMGIGGWWGSIPNTQTIDVPDNVSFVRATLINWGDYRYKLEKGNIATDWTPAPEDTATVTQVSILENTIDGFRSQVSSIEEDYDGVAGQVATHTSEISNLNGQIALKASQSSVDTLSGTVNTLGAQMDVTAGQISSKVWMTDIDGIEVGGRNYFSPKGFIANGLSNGLSGSNISYIEREGYRYPGFRHSSIAYAENYFNYLEGEFEENTRYTLSFDYQFSGSHQDALAGMRIVYTDGTIQNINVRGLNDRGTKEVKSSNNKTIKHISMRGWAHSGTFDVWKIYLKKGAVSTDWTPALEDTAEIINHVESELTQKYDSITATVSSIDGRVAAQKVTLDSISSTVSGHGGRLSTVEQTASGLQTTVASKASQSQVTQLANGLSSVVSDFKNLLPDSLLISKAVPQGTTIGSVENSVLYHNIPVKPNVTYTLSYNKLATSPNLKVMTFTDYDGEVTSHNNAYGRSKRSRELNVPSGGSFTTTASEQYVFITTGNVIVNLHYIQYRVLQLEEGSEATGWSRPYGALTQISQLADNINLRVTKGDVMSQINIEAGRTLIESKKIVLNADTTIIRGTTWMDGAVIKDATIASAKITSLDVSKISGNTSNFVSSAWNTAAGGNVSITGSGILSTDNTNSQTYIQNGVIGFRTSAGHGLGYIGVSQSGDRTNWNQDVSNGSNWLLRYRYTGGFDTVFEYVSYRDRLQAGVTLSMTENDIIGVDNVYSNYFRFSGGGYLRTNSTNSAVEIKSITSMSLQTGSGQAFRLDNTHGYMFRTLSMEGNNITNQSDARLKFNFKEITMDVLAEFKSMEFLEFDRTNGLHDDIGLIAQNTPSLSLYDEVNDIWSINSSKQIMMNSLGIQRLAIMEENTNAVASQALTKVEELELEVKELKEELSELRKEVA